VPILKKNYNERKPIKEHIPLKDFIEKYWVPKDPRAYLHQWQFPLSDTVGEKLCYQSAPMECLGDDLMVHWIDICRGDSPLQYIFMGPKSTYTKLHRDNGGLAITIAPLVGRKEMTMVHRDDSDKLYSLQVDLANPDIDRYPLVAFARVWRQVIEPGQILFMPEGTYHAARNCDGCLSYSRFHLDSVNLPGFFRSFCAEDAPEIAHAEIVWNSSHDLMHHIDGAVEEMASTGDEAKITPAIDRHVVSLRSLRHIIRAFQLQVTLCPAARGWDWAELLQDVDFSLHRYERRSSKSMVKTAMASKYKASPLTCRVKKGREVDKREAGPVEEADAKNGVADTLLQNALWAKWQLQEGDIVMVAYLKRQLQGAVLQVTEGKLMAKVHYTGWAPTYDEYQPVEDLRITSPAPPMHAGVIDLSSESTTGDAMLAGAAGGGASGGGGAAANAANADVGATAANADGGATAANTDDGATAANTANADDGATAAAATDGDDTNGEGAGSNAAAERKIQKGDTVAVAWGSSERSKGKYKAEVLAVARINTVQVS
jgi:hypothetical protein